MFDKGSGQEDWVTRQEIISGTWASYSGQGDGDLNRDPLFVSGWPNVDFHLQPDSSAINAGGIDLAP